MNEKLFECTICLGVCRECIHCLDCHQILCKEHVQHLRSNRCPSCRESPFRFEENIALQRIIEQMMKRTNTKSEEQQQRRRLQEKLATNIQQLYRGWKRRTRTTGGSTSTEIGPNGTQPTITRPTIAAESSMEATNAPPEAATTATTINIPEEGDENNLRQYGFKIPRRPPHQDQFKKLPNESHERLMLWHISECNDENCRSLWRGRWGSFIGGAHGRTHFDLTHCPVGKRLNEQIGWNYNDPRC